VKVLVELSPTVDVANWARMHDAGLVPDRVPYGLDRLVDEGLSVLVRQPPRSRAVNLAGRLGARLTAGARWPESVLGRPRPSSADVRLCWDERSGIPASIARTRRYSRVPVVSGIIWVSEQDAELSWFARRTVRAALRRADAVFVLSSGQIPVLREHWGVDGSHVHVVHFGVDTDFWDPCLADVKACVSSQYATVLSVGNDRHRDHDLLVSAMRTVHDGNRAARLDLVTRLPVKVPAEIGTRRPSVSHPLLRDLYRSAHVVAICTRVNNHASGITAILEAMAMGKAVVATRSPGLDEYVTHGETGLLVPSGDRDSLAATLVRTLGDDALRARLGAAARQRVLSRFSTQAMGARLAELLRSVVPGGPQSSESSAGEQGRQPSQ
jgi:glycosyltransferase involved in cell wall biosynthesis